MGVQIEGFLNLQKNDLIKLEFKKNEYFENQLVEGTIIFLPSENTTIDEISIKMKMFQSFNITELKKKITNGLLQKNIFFKRLNLPIIFNTLKTRDIPIKLGINKIPFNFFLPKNIPPSFEYPRENKKGYIRYVFTCQIISGKKKYISEQYFIIKQRPFIYPPNTTLKLSDKKLIKTVGSVIKGESTLYVFTHSKNFKLNEPMNYEIDIDNTNCEDDVNKIKFKVIRTVTFKKKQETFKYETKIIKKKYSIKCLKGEKYNFKYNDMVLRDSELKDIYLHERINPYLGVINDLNILMPSMETPLIKCEYKLVISLLFDSDVPKKDRPTIEIPIYASHQSQSECEGDKIIIKGQIKNFPPDCGIYTPIYNFQYEYFDNENNNNNVECKNNNNVKCKNNNNYNNNLGNYQIPPQDYNNSPYPVFNIENDYPTLESINRAMQINNKNI